MKRFILIVMMILLTMNTPFAYAQTQAEETSYVLYAVSAGKADALLLKVGDYTCLIDTGYTRSRGKILYAMEQLGIDHLDAVFITHTDNDHTDGLDWLAQSEISIGAWYAPAYSTGVKDDKHPAVLAAAVRNEQVTWLKAGDSFDLGEARLQVLAPGCQFDDKDDNNSLVMMLNTPYGRLLLCGDMEYTEEAWLLKNGVDLKCDVLKVPNHADNDVCSQQFILATSPSIAVISTDTQEKPETPDPVLMKRLSSVCDVILQTQDTDGGVMISMTSAGIHTALVSLPEMKSGISITNVDPENDTITVQNDASEAVDLSGWYMLMDRKNTFFIFHKGTVLQSGCSLVIGSSSAKGTLDYVWDEKKLINRKKEDGVILYDDHGKEVSYRTNGL